MNRKIKAALTVTIVGAGLILAVGSPAAAACVTIPAVAHRGGDERYVENTGNGFRDAGNRGVLQWETDVRFTSDDVPVIMHDDTVDRTTGGTGAVADLTYAQLAALRTADDQSVPTLAQLVNDAAVDGARVFVELKTVPTEAQWVTFLTAMGSRPIASRLVVTSFDGPTLVAARAHSTLYATGLIQNVGDQTVASVTQYAGTKILIKHHDAITAGRMTNWVGGGLTVYSWTVDTTAEMERMTWYKIAGVITDKPGAYLAWQRGRVC